MSSKKEPIIVRVAGPLVVAQNMEQAQMYEVVRVGEEGLVGEVIETRRRTRFNPGVRRNGWCWPGEPVKLTGQTLSVELGPGLLESIYDGVQRPLGVLEDKSGHFLARGIDAPGLDQTKKWEFVPTVNKGDTVTAGDIIGTVQETTLITHKVMVPATIQGEATVESIESGHFNVTQDIAKLKTKKVLKLFKCDISGLSETLEKLLENLFLLSH